MNEQWTEGDWVPEYNKPTFNPGANAYQRAIIQLDNGRIIPGFAFGESEAECTANAWIMASSKDLLHALSLFLKQDAGAVEYANKVLFKVMGNFESNKAINSI